MILENLIRFSNFYGADASLVLAGGGNTSAKENGYMYVKGSGTALATIKADGFVKIDLEKLGRIFTAEYSENDSEREAQVLADLMASRAAGEESKRPSVETTLHALFEQTYVLHLHPALVNGLSCSQGGFELAKELMPADFIWVDSCKPGYILAMLCCEKMRAFKEEKGRAADVILLQNHGIFIADNTVEGLDKKLKSVMAALESRLVTQPDLNGVAPDKNAEKIGNTLAAAVNGTWKFIGSPSAMQYCIDKCAASDLLRPFTPDHIVYCKAYPLWLSADADIAASVKEYSEKYGFAPRIVIAEKTGIFCVGTDEKQAKTAKMLFEDALKIAVYTKSFGGALHMTDEMTDFIVNWEVEAYRSAQNK